MNDSAVCRLENGGGVEVVAIEDGEDAQSLWVRVGPVYDGDAVRPEPGVWICYQEHHMAGPLAGPVLLTPQVWRELTAAVEGRLRRRSIPGRLKRRMREVLREGGGYQS